MRNLHLNKDTIFLKVKLIGTKRSKLLLGLILSLFSLASVIAGVVIVKNRNRNLIERSHAAGVEMALVSAKTNILPNEEFNVQVYLNTKDRTVSGAQIRVRYNSDYFVAKNITLGNFLPVILKTGDLFTVGIADITLGSQPENPKKGTGVLATVKFKAKTKKGTSKIFFGPGYTEVAAIGQNSNVAGDFQPLILTVSSGPTNTATPTAPATITPTPALNLQCRASCNPPNYWKTPKKECGHTTAGATKYWCYLD